MRGKKAEFSRVIFWGVLAVCLTIGSLILSRMNQPSTEFRTNIITLASASVLLSLACAGWASIRTLLVRIWLGAARRTATTYIETQIRQYGSQIRILGLKDNYGTVALLLDGGSVDGIYQGMRLEIVTDPGGEMFGEVEVIEISDSRCTVSPTNRTNATFWEMLEDRMKHDVSAPPNVVAKRPIPGEAIGFIETLLQKRRRHGY